MRFALIALVALAVAPPAAAQNAILAGRVIDSITGEGVSAVHVEVVASRSRIIATSLSDSTGAVVIGPFPAGRYTLRLQRVGYATSEEPITAEAGVTPRLEFALTPAPVALPGVAAQGRAQPALGAMSGFWQRRERGLGHFVTREDIERIRPMRTEDILRTVPGARIESVGYGRVAIFGRVRNASGAPCIPATFVNGMPYVMTERGLDDFAPDEIEAVEVYSGASRIPAEFNATGSRAVAGRRDNPIVGSPRCGAIVIWTRR
jgi:hypothetical protein